MKPLLLGTALALVLGSSVSAQDLFRTEVDMTAIVASEFIGKRVYAAEAELSGDEFNGVQQDWNDIGEINDVILTRDGRVDSVLVDIGGFLGMGERQIAVSMESIRFVNDSGTAEDMNDFFLVISADRTTLEGAPEYMRQNGAMNDGDNAAATDGAATTGTDTGAAATDGTMAAEGEVVTDGTVAGTETSGEGYMDAASMTSEQLMGVRVYGQNGEDVGEISDIVLDADGKATQIIVDVGGFLGIGEKPVAIDMTQLQIMQEPDGGAMTARVQMTKEEIEDLPAQE